MLTLDKGVEQSSWMMSGVMELNPTLQTVHTSPATTVGTVRMLESDVLVSVHVWLLASGLPLYKTYCIVGNFREFWQIFLLFTKIKTAIFHSLCAYSMTHAY